MKGAASLSSVRFSPSPHSPAQFPSTARLLVASWVFMAVSTQIRSEGNSKRKPSLSPSTSSKFPWWVGQKGMPPHHQKIVPSSPEPTGGTLPSATLVPAPAGGGGGGGPEMSPSLSSRDAADRYPPPRSLAHRGRGHGKVGVLGMGWEATTPPARPVGLPLLCSA